jgi:hypothetical protein
VRERIDRDVAAQLAACLRELDERLDQPVRRLERQTFGAGPHLQHRAARHLLRWK